MGENKYQQVLKWRKEHPEEVREYNKKYYQENQEIIRQKRRERYMKQKLLKTTSVH